MIFLKISYSNKSFLESIAILNSFFLNSINLKLENSNIFTDTFPNYDFVTEICARSLYVKVISPPSLAEEVKGYLKEAYEQYLS